MLKELPVEAALPMARAFALTPAERDDVHESLQRDITTAWQTDEVLHHRPTPLDEVRWGLVV